jgi:hypothetical protein
VLGHRKSQQLPPLMAKDKAYEEPPKGNRRDDKQINGCNLLPVIAKERLPALQRPALSRQHIGRNRGLRDIDAQFEQLAVDPGSTPQRVLNAHSSDQVAHLIANPWPAAAPTGFPLPKCRLSHAMPTDNRLRPDDGDGVKNAREAAIEPNEQRTVNPTQMQSAWGTLLQDIELMPKSQDFGF